MRSSKNLADSLDRVRRRFWIAFTILVLIVAVVWCLAACHFVASQAGDPLVGGPAGFTLLAIVVAFSAYLRGVASDADKQRDQVKEKIAYVQGNEELKKAYEEKLSTLDGKWENLHVAAPFMMLLSLALTIRLLVEAVVRGGLLKSHLVAFRVADVVVLTWLLLTFLPLCALHHFGWRRDEEIRARILAATKKV